MRGQWLGTYSGTNSGQIVLEIDEDGFCFEGTAYLYESNTALPGIHAYFRTNDKQPRQKVRAKLGAIDPETGAPIEFAKVAHKYPDVVVSEFADAEFWWTPDNLSVRWSTAVGTSGIAKLAKGKAAAPSECPLLPASSWAEFKEFATTLPPHQLIFRGQPGTWRLRTAFHRTGKANLDRYLNATINAVHRHLSGTTNHKYDLRDPLQNAAFYNLIQHHGFPTPLLDWTYSPFVAAHFAFTETQSTDASEFVRIYVFDKVSWCQAFEQIQNTNIRLPHFSIIEALALDNTRMIPQQALSSFTNVDDIETYIRAREQPGVPYLRAVDLPRSERAEVIRELRLMGITPGSLFPGLDGACAELRERFFPPVAE